MLRRRTIRILGGITLLLASVQVCAAPPPPNVNRCKSSWVLTSLQGIAFGAFTIESGSGTLRIDSSGALTTTGAVTTASTYPVTTFTVTVDNQLDRTVCGTYPFDLSWGVVPAPLTGPGTAIPLSNVLVSEPTLIPTPTALPITGLTTANLPITLTFQGELTTTFPQAAGLYTSPAFTLDLIQGGKATSASGVATAISLTLLSLAETVPMDFGMVAGGSLAGTVVLDTTGARSVTGDAQILATSPGIAASFQLLGEPGQSYSLSISGPAVLTTVGGDQITATGFRDNSSGVLPAGGSEIFQVGATLNLGPLQAAGDYSTANGGGAPYTLTVNYN